MKSIYFRKFEVYISRKIVLINTKLKKFRSMGNLNKANQKKKKTSTSSSLKTNKESNKKGKVKSELLLW